MRFDVKAYLREIVELVESGAAQMARKHPVPTVFTVSIYTDADAAVSAISFDTEEHSTRSLIEIVQYEREQYEKLMAQGNVRLSRHFLPNPDARGRNCNPADFAFPSIAEVSHASFASGWDESSKGRCWDLLGPALRQAVDLARPILATLPLHVKAEIGINGPRDWFEHVWPLTDMSPSVE